MSVAPGKRPLSSSVPTIVEMNGRVEAVLGASGGSRITTAVAQALINWLDFGMNIQQSISAPRLHHQLLPNQVWVENNYDSDRVDWLKSKKHQVLTLKTMTLADVQGIVRMPDGSIQAGADRRKGGRAAAY
jgi:gamma-glutamyltranspeptidase/glutathione hydrolase/leukotriene-C4 hydrolase